MNNKDVCAFRKISRRTVGGREKKRGNGGKFGWTGGKGEERLIGRKRGSAEEKYARGGEG